MPSLPVLSGREVVKAFERNLIAQRNPASTKPLCNH